MSMHQMAHPPLPHVHSPVAADVGSAAPAQAAPAVARRYAPKQPGHSRPVLWLGAGHRQSALGLSWIGLRTSRRLGA